MTAPHPITVAELEALARIMNAHWPARPLVAGDFDLQVMAGELAANGVALEDAHQAVRELVADGFQWGPRAPDIMRVVRRRRGGAAAGPRPVARGEVGPDGLARWERDAIAAARNTGVLDFLREVERDGSEVARAQATALRCNGPARAGHGWVIPTEEERDA